MESQEEEVCMAEATAEGWSVAISDLEAATRVVTRAAGRAVAEMVRGIQEEGVKVRVDVALVVAEAVRLVESRGWVVERSVAVDPGESRGWAVERSVAATAPVDPDKGAVVEMVQAKGVG